MQEKTSQQVEKGTVNSCQLCPKCGTKTDQFGTCGNCGFDQETGGHIHSAAVLSSPKRDLQKEFCHNCAKCKDQDPSHCPLETKTH